MHAFSSLSLSLFHAFPLYPLAFHHLTPSVFDGYRSVIFSSPSLLPPSFPIVICVALSLLNTARNSVLLVSPVVVAKAEREKEKRL